MKNLVARTIALSVLSLSAVVSCGQSSDGHNEDDHGAEEEEKGHEELDIEGTVTIDTTAVERVGIVVSKVEAAPTIGGISVPAEIVAEPQKVAHISSVVSGQLASVSVSIGDIVKPKQALANVRSIQLGEARAQSGRARANMQAAQANFARHEELQKTGVGAKKMLIAARAELAKAKAEVNAAARTLEVYGRGGRGSEIAITAPIAGQIVERHASVGEMVSPSQILFKVTDISSVWIVGRVYQQNAGKVNVGATASLTLQAYPGRTWQGAIDYVAPTLDESTRTLAVRMRLDNPEGVLRPGLFGALSISPNSDTGNAPFIKADAIQKFGDRLVVFVPEDEPGSYHAIPVAVGQRSQGRVQVISGLAIGDNYVSSGAFVLKSELLRGDLGEGHVH